MSIRDIRQKVLGGELKLKKEVLWVDRWEEWVMIQEFDGEERSALIKACASQKTGQINITTFYPHLAIASVRYPDAETEPADVEVPVLDENKEPLLDNDGNPITKLAPPAHIEAFPTLEERQGNPLAGMLIFRNASDPTKPDVAVRDAVNKTSGAALEVIGQAQSRLSALLPQDLFEKKGK